MDYLRPDVYVEKINTGEQPIQILSTSTGAMIGKSPRGEAFKPVLVTSWSDFLRKFAKGMPMPFIKEDFLAYSVYGFFQNGGSRLYVQRVVDSGAKKSTGTLTVPGVMTVASGDPKGSEKTPTVTPRSQYTVTFTAKDEGKWGDELSVEIKEKVGVEGFDLIVKLSGAVVETFEVTNGEDSNYYYKGVINNNSNFITTEGEGDLVAGTVAFTGGKLNYSAVTDEDYKKAINNFGLVEERISLIAIPGVTTDAVIQELLTYSTKHGIYPIFDVPFNTNTENTVTYRQKLIGDNGSIHYPNIKVVDPLSKQGTLKVCPISGHMMGVYARTDNERGVFKVPAGEQAVIKGAVALERDITAEDLEILNPIGVNCLVVRPNRGVISWGGRSISNDPKLRYISDVRLDQVVEYTAYRGTQWAVFEPNDEDLRERLTASLKGMLNTMYDRGWFKGKTSEQAYYVKCDGDLNTQESIDKGEVIAEIGYAKKRPAEFVVIKIVQKSSEAKAN